MEIVGGQSWGGGTVEGGVETREDAVGLGTGTGTVEGWERASATTFSIPGMCTIELVNSAR